MRPPETGRDLKLALDQNFPTDLLEALRGWLPAEVEVTHIAVIDPRMSDLDDDQLVIALRQMNFDGLVTNNYKMLDVPHEVAAIVATKAVVVAIEGMGHDPIRAAGAVLLELPGLPDRVIPNQANVFRLNFTRRRAEPAWTYLGKLATKMKVSTHELWEASRPEDIESPVLD